MKETKSLRPALKAGYVILILVMLALGGTRVGLSQNTFRLLRDFPTIGAAIAGANADDTICVGSGRWCGADAIKRLDLIGEGGATIIAWSGNPEASDSKFGFRLKAAASGTTIRNLVFKGRVKSVSRNRKVAHVPGSVQGDSPHTLTWWCEDLNQVWKVKVPVISWEGDLVPPDPSPILDPCTTAFPVVVPEGSSFAPGNFLWYTNETYEPAVRDALQEMGYNFHSSSPAEDFMSKLADIRVEVRTFPANVLVAEHRFDPQRSFHLVRGRDFFGRLLPLVGPIVNPDLGIDLSLDEVGRLPMHGFPVIIPPAGAPGEYQILVYLTMSDWHNDGLGLEEGNMLPAGEFPYVGARFTVVP